MPGHMGDERVHRAEPPRRPGPSGRRRDPDQRRGPRREWQLRRRPPCQEEAQTGGSRSNSWPRTVLTVEAAKAANIDVVENGKYTQVVHDTVVAYRANRRSGTASHQDQGRRHRLRRQALAPEGHRPRPRRLQVARPSGSAAASSSARSPATTPRRSAKASKRLALRKALSERIKAGDVLVVDRFAVSEPKTKQFVAAHRRHHRRSRRCSSSPPPSTKPPTALRATSQPTLLITAVRGEHRATPQLPQDRRHQRRPRPTRRAHRQVT